MFSNQSQVGLFLVREDRADWKACSFLFHGKLCLPSCVDLIKVIVAGLSSIERTELTSVV